MGKVKKSKEIRSRHIAAVSGVNSAVLQQKQRVPNMYDDYAPNGVQANVNLNTLMIPDDNGSARYDLNQIDYSVRSDDGQTEVVLERIVPAIAATDTSVSIRRRLVAWRGSRISIFWIRWPGARPCPSWCRKRTSCGRIWVRVRIGRESLRQKYDALPGDERMCHQDSIVGSSSTGYSPTLESVRCVGNHNADKDAAFPRAHHKFLVMGDIVPGEDEFTYHKFIPRAVWTGSFNLTMNATNSFENAVILRDPKLVNAFYQGSGRSWRSVNRWTGGRIGLLLNSV